MLCKSNYIANKLREKKKKKQTKKTVFPPPHFQKDRY